MKLAISSFVFVSVLLVSSFADGVGADEYIRDDVPWLVSIQAPDGKHFCNGALVNESWVLTTASCLKYIQDSNLEVLLGTYLNFTDGDNSLYLNITEKCLHEEYDEDSKANDVAILKLSSKAVTADTDKDWIQLANLPVKPLNIGDQWTLFGWKNQTTEFESFNVEVLPEADCSLEKEGACVKPESSSNLKDTINSFVMYCDHSPSNNEVCGLAISANDTAAALTEVYYYHDWINQIIKDGECSGSASLFHSMIFIVMGTLISFFRIL